MNLKSVAMATGLVLTFAAGAWLSTVMLASPQRASRVAVQERAPSSSAPVPKAMPEMPVQAPDPAASSSILPPLPPAPAEPAPAPVPVALQTEPPPAEQAAQPPEPPAAAEVPPPEPSPAPMAAVMPDPPPPPPAPPPEPPAAPPTPVADAPTPPAAAETSEPAIDPGIAALSDLVTRPASAPPTPPSPASRRAMAPESAPAPSASTKPSTAQDGGPYFTIQVGSFQDPVNAASLIRSLATKGWEAFTVDWTNSTGQVWKVVRVGRYQTEAQATSASGELFSAANLRGNVIRVR
jgi:hypothetical protein